MKTKYFLPMIGMAALLLFASACGFIPSRGSGDLISETRQVSGYDAVAFSGAGEVEIIQDGTESITIETDDDVMEYVTTEVVNGTLQVGLDFNGMLSIFPTRLKVTLHVVELQNISASGAWEVRADTLECDDLEVLISGTGEMTFAELTASSLNANISGAGKMNIGGQVGSQAVGISGTGEYSAGDLESETADIEISGAGEATLWVTTALTVEVSGAGQVDYYGSPTVEFDQSGAGTIHSLGEK